MEIKNCPFCGGTASIQYRRQNGNPGDWFGFVRCDVCHAESNTVNITNHDYATRFDDPTDAQLDIAKPKILSAWNIRANDNR